MNDMDGSVSERSSPAELKERDLWEYAKTAGFSRRGFAVLLAAGGSAAVLAACGKKSSTPKTQKSVPADKIVIPPPDAKVVTTACKYCIVGCGYKAFVWPKGKEGGLKASENALKVDFPVDGNSGEWISPNMQNVVQYKGKPHHITIIPDWKTKVVNVGGDHSGRGGTTAPSLYNSKSPTKDRLKQPQLRVDDKLVPIPWDAALDLVADLSKHVLEKYGELAWGMKMFSYQFYENTYALTKLALGKIGTPAWVTHDKPASGSDTPGLSDAGIDAFSAAYKDWKLAEVIFVSGISLYETKSILFQQWVVPGGAKMIAVNPRRDFTAAWAEKNGGIFLQLKPGTDTVLNNAIARVILENGWEDNGFISKRTANASDLKKEEKWRRKMFGMTFSDYRKFILKDDAYKLGNAAKITGVPEEKIRKAAEMMAKPRRGGKRPITSLMLEKGNYWTHNYQNTASFASLGLLVGAGGSPGRMMARGGGHQRGMIKGGDYPTDKSPTNSKGNNVELNVDKWVAEGNVRFMWVVGATWLAGMGASQHLRDVVRDLTVESKQQLSSEDAFEEDDRKKVNVKKVVDVLKKRMEDGGMVLTQQEIYANPLTDFADIVLPAATWGEEDFARMQGERRLRLYGKFMDAPGDSKPDWWIAAEIAKRMGFDGFDWKNSNEVFEEASEKSIDTVHDYAPLVKRAKNKGKTGHEFLDKLGTTGIQCPIKEDGGKLVGTVRLHGDKFKTESGKAIFVKGDWSEVEPIQKKLEPSGDELWVTNMRTNETWSSMFDDVRVPFRRVRTPRNILEINPKDADDHDIESGDWVEVENDKVPTQSGGTYKAKFKAIAYVTDEVPPGITCSYFNADQGDLEQAANSVVSGETDPIMQRYQFKLGKGRIKGKGKSEWKDKMVFTPRNIA